MCCLFLLMFPIQLSQIYKAIHQGNLGPVDDHESLVAGQGSSGMPALDVGDEVPYALRSVLCLLTELSKKYMVHL